MGFHGTMLNYMWENKRVSSIKGFVEKHSDERSLFQIPKCLVISEKSEHR